MKTKKLPLEAVNENRDNPRVISDSRFEKLVDNILTFPKMLDIRPVVIDKDNISIGGNRRHAALRRIAGMSKEQISDRLGGGKRLSRNGRKSTEDFTFILGAMAKETRCNGCQWR